MFVYVTNPAGEKNYATIRKMQLGIVRLANRWQFPVGGIRWFADNGAFSAWQQNKEFDSKLFLDMLDKIENCSNKPDFVVCPDIVSGGYESLDFSLEWLNRIPAGIPVYLAVQDGMDPLVISDYTYLFDGLFVGGSMDWKLNNMHIWVELAHHDNIPCHVGRIGNLKTMLRARDSKVDSIDSCNFCRNDSWDTIPAVQSQTTLCYAWTPK